MDALLCIGGAKVYLGNMWGVAYVLAGAFFVLGFRVIQGSDPRKIGLILFLGNRTRYTAESLTLLLNWLPFFEIIDIVEFDTQMSDLDFEVETLRSCDGVRMKGKVSLGIKPDEDYLAEFDDAKGVVGIKSQLEESIVSWLQDIAEKPNHTWKWLETHSVDIQRILRAKLEGEDENDTRDNDLLVNAKGLGFKIVKLSVKFTPVNPAVITADEDSQIEELQRGPELSETSTINMQAKARLEMYLAGRLSPDEKIPTLAECRDQIMFERLAKDKKVQIVQGGRTVNLNKVGNTDK